MSLLCGLKLERVHAIPSLRLAGIVMAIVVAVSGCGGGPPPRLYLLDEQVILTPPDAPDVQALNALGISQVKVPGYANDARIAVRNTRGEVVLLDSRRWAEDPEEAITRLFTMRLRARATATVLVEPWPRDYDPQARVEVAFDRLLREPDGGAHMVGQIQLLSGDGRALLRSVPFDINVVGRSTETQEFFRAVTFGVDAIARIAVENLVNTVEKAS